MMPRRIKAFAMSLIGVFAILLSASVQAELRVVDGNLWNASTMSEKRAYLIGVANAVAVDRAIQVKRGRLDPQSTTSRLDAALDAGTIDRAIERIDAWYAANPSRNDAPVLGVIWLDMVKKSR